MAAPKGNKRSPKNPLDYQICVGKCKKNKKLVSDFYSTDSDLYGGNKKYPVCKKCLTENLPPEDLNSTLYMDAIKSLLREINKPFIAQIWQSSIEEAQRRNWQVINSYMKNIALLSKSATSKDSDFNQSITQEEKIQEHETFVEKNSIEMTSNDQRNMDDVLRLVGYDPFESENQSDKKHLYNRLIDFLDEGTLEDNFKLSTVIEIAICFRQIDKINNAISKITENTSAISTEVGKIKSLFDTKEKMLKSVLALAKDNGISVNHNNNKSKGAGTLSGIIKQLHEKGISAAEINIYDIETCEGMRQVADISNRSIMEQLMLNENDYTEMIKDQRDMILSLTEKSESLEEENRLLKVKLKFAEIDERRTTKYIDGEIL